MTRIAQQLHKDSQVGYTNNLEHILDELKRLDLLIHQRLLKKQEQEGASAFDQFKGLVLLEDEMLGLVSGNPGDENVDEPNESAAQMLVQDIDQLESWIAERRARGLESGVDLWLPRLAELFNLSRLDEECLLVCLAAEMDPKYGKLYAYLHDDVTRKRPSVELVLSLFFDTIEEKLAARSAFDAQSPLIRYRLLQVTDSSPDRNSPLISRSLKLDDRIVSFLLGSRQIDARLQPAACVICSGSETEPTMLIEGVRSRVVRFVKEHSHAARPADQSVGFYFSGPYGSEKRLLASAICHDLDIPLIAADISKMLASEIPFGEMIWLLGREAELLSAALSLENFDSLVADDDRYGFELKALEETIRAFSKLTFLIGLRSRKPQDFLGNFIHIDFPVPDDKSRKRSWEISLTEITSLASNVDAQALAGKFRLTPGQIRDAVSAAETLARWRSPDDVRVTMADLSAGCRAQANPRLGTLASKIEPRWEWDDIVLPADQMAQLTEICNQTRHRYAVYGEWGFDRKLPLGKGVTALFTGPPGTGKSMAAEVIANRLNLDLYKIDLSQVVSKYIGETEKKLHQVFDEAQSSNSILFFDEADALFGKRSEVKDAHDRYANIEVGYLLQKMEEYDGIAILATNLHRNMDEAFTRRIRVIVDFPFPDEQHRRLIWKLTFPPEAPVSDEVDFNWLAREIRLAGGNIKNIALAAAFLAADEGSAIRMSHLLQAARREFKKIGRIWNEEKPDVQE